jgi:hypothetical protein
MAKRTSSTKSSEDGAAAKPKRSSRARAKASGGAASAPEVAADAAGAITTAVSPSEALSAPPPLNEAPASNGATATVSMSSEPSEEDIRLRAYHKFLHRGRDAGSDWDDWFGAEKELRRTADAKKRQLS